MNPGLVRLTPPVLGTRNALLVYRRETWLSEPVRAVIRFVVEVMRERAEQLVFNTGDLIIAAVLAGLGLAWVPEDLVKEHITAGRLASVLDEWAATYPGYHLYYASRRASPALALVVEALRHTEDG